jgi:hypothetical protein
VPSPTAATPDHRHPGLRSVRAQREPERITRARIGQWQRAAALQHTSSLTYLCRGRTAGPTAAPDRRYKPGISPESHRPREVQGRLVENEAHRSVVARVAILEEGIERLAVLLGVSSSLVTRWIEGLAPIPPDIFLRCVDLLLEHNPPPE